MAQVSYDIDGIHQLAERVAFEADLGAALVAGLNSKVWRNEPKSLCLALAQDSQRNITLPAIIRIQGDLDFGPGRFCVLG